MNKKREEEEFLLKDLLSLILIDMPLLKFMRLFELINP
jgi:hypothetical protein